MKLGGPDADLEGASKFGMENAGIEEGIAPGLEETLSESVEASEQDLGRMSEEGAQTDELEDQVSDLE